MLRVELHKDRNDSLNNLYTVGISFIRRAALTVLNTLDTLLSLLSLSSCFLQLTKVSEQALQYSSKKSGYSCSMRMIYRIAVLISRTSVALVETCVKLAPNILL